MLSAVLIKAFCRKRLNLEVQIAVGMNERKRERLN